MRIAYKTFKDICIALLNMQRIDNRANNAYVFSQILIHYNRD